MTHDRTVTFVIYSEYLGKLGGRETWLRAVTAALAQGGTSVRVICFAGTAAGLTAEGGRVRRIVTLRTVFGTFFPVVIRATLGLALLVDMAVFIRKSARELATPGHHGPVIAMNSVIEGLGAWIGCRRSARDFIVSVRGKAPQEMSRLFPWLGPALGATERMICRRAYRVWANGHDTARYLAAQGIASIVIPNGVDCNGAQAAPEEPPLALREAVDGCAAIVLSVATLRPIKGIGDLVRAVPVIVGEAPGPVTIVFAGGGDPRRYREALNRRGLEQQALFLGAVPSKRVLPYADVVVCVSGGAGMSMSALEAMAASKPIVAWDSEVYRQILTHRRTALLVPEGDSRALGRAIVLLLRDRELRARLGARAREEVRSFDWSAVAERVRSELEAR